eukprot:CFRG7069T1
MVDSTSHELTGLLLLCLFMFLGCFLAGSLPLSVQMSEKNLILCNTLGAGLLVGTALAVIVPEGFHSLMEADAESGNGHAHEHGVPNVTVHDHAHDHSHNDESGSFAHTWAGLVLVGGFLFQLLVDRLIINHDGHSHGQPSMAETGAARPKKGLSATIGLMVHSAADGIAMGAASAAGESSVELLVFAAIMLHKAPAAFGLVSYLLADGLDKRKVREHLLAFSVAAPLMAITTFALIKMSSSFNANSLPDSLEAVQINGLSSMDGITPSTDVYTLGSQENQNLGTFEEENSGSSPVTGLALLFSAGTFLYVATIHVLPEVTSKAGSEGLTRKQLVMLCLGIILPPFLSMGHHH